MYMSMEVLPLYLHVHVEVLLLYLHVHVEVLLLCLHVHVEVLLLYLHVHVEVLLLYLHVHVEVLYLHVHVEVQLLASGRPSEATKVAFLHPGVKGVSSTDHPYTATAIKTKQCFVFKSTVALETCKLTVVLKSPSCCRISAICCSHSALMSRMPSTIWWTSRLYTVPFLTVVPYHQHTFPSDSTCGRKRTLFHCKWASSISYNNKLLSLEFFMKSLQIFVND